MLGQIRWIQVQCLKHMWRGDLLSAKHVNLLLPGVRNRSIETWSWTYFDSRQHRGCHWNRKRIGLIDNRTVTFRSIRLGFINIGAENTQCPILILLTKIFVFAWYFPGIDRTIKLNNRKAAKQETAVSDILIVFSQRKEKWRNYKGFK